MNTEEQVTSLPISRKLKEIGTSQESLFYWVTTNLDKEFYLVIADSFDTITSNLKSVYQDSGHEGDSWDVQEVYSAFTVAELGKLLPFAVASEKKIGIPSLGWRAILDIPTKITHTEEAHTEADARAKMLIYLTNRK